MKLQRYQEFTNEGIISKGLELLNYKRLKRMIRLLRNILI